MLVIRDAFAPALLEAIAGFAAALLDARPRTEEISREGKPFIERWMLARKVTIPRLYARGQHDPEGEARFEASEIENLYIHRYARSDKDDPHDHPWPNATLIVSGWLVEESFDGAEWSGSETLLPGTIVARGANECHALTACAPGTVTLFATGAKERDWGFWTAKGLVPWRSYHERERAA